VHSLCRCGEQELTVCPDNSVIAPDMSAIPSSVFAVSVDEWRSMDEASRHLYICLVAQHRTVCRSGDESQNRMLFHRHQAYAAQCLHRKLLKLGSKDPDPRLVEATSMFVCSQLQASVYGPWRIHLEGAKALLQRWGGYGSLLGRCDFACYILVTTDIYGTTTSPQALLGAETVSQHRLYERLLEQLQIDTWMTVVPVPIDILLATIHINILRADASADMDGNEDAVALRARESLSILSSLRSFDPRAWAMRLPAPTLRHLEGWMMLATCFQAATILYLFLGQPHGVLMDAESQGIRLASYHTLVAMVLELHRERRQDGKHYKFITWPMVMCGIEAVVQRDGVEIKFLCDALDVTTTDLGCMAMRDAADFLAALWRRTEKARAGSEEDVELNWNNVFERAPVFLM